MGKSLIPWLVPLGIVAAVLIALSNVAVGLLFVFIGVAFAVGYAYVRNRNADSDSW